MDFKYIIKILFIVLLLIYAISCQKRDRNSPQTQTPKQFDPFKFLKKYGYLKEEIVKNKISKNFHQLLQNEEVAAIRQFQLLNQLPITGKVDAPTEKKMKSKRCGFPDLAKDKKSKFSKYSFADTKWPKTNLKWKLLNYTLDLGENKTRLSLNRAFQLWAQVTPLEFMEVCKACEADISIDFARYMHDNEDEDDAFDGENGILAHAASPPDGRIHFDDDEYFTDSNSNGINFPLIASHEIGHSLGLEHSQINGALMNAYYNPAAPIELTGDDVKAIQALYGKPNAIKSTSSTRMSNTITSKHQTTSVSTTKNISNSEHKHSQACLDSYNAVFSIPGKDNQIYVIVDSDQLWSYNIKLKSWERLILYSEFPQIESNVRGGSSCKNNYLWFFKGDKAWAYTTGFGYTKFNLVSGFPKRINGLNEIDATVSKNGKIYLIKNDHAYQFDSEKLEIKKGEKLKKFFGVAIRQMKIDAIFTYNSLFYIFENNMVYKLNNNDKFQNLNPKERNQLWFPCFGYSSNEPTTTEMLTTSIIYGHDYHHKKHNNNNHHHHHHHHHHRHNHKHPSHHKDNRKRPW